MPTIIEQMLQKFFQVAVNGKKTPAYEVPQRPQHLFTLRSHTGELVDYTDKQVCDWLAEPVVPGAYVSWLMSKGYPVVYAKLAAALAVRHGKRVARESRELPKLIAALRFLAKPGRRKSSFLRRVRYILDAIEHSTTADSLFAEIGGDAGLQYQLRQAAGGDDDVFRKIVEITAEMLPKLPEVRGRKVSAASAAHHFLMEDGPSSGCRYSWNAYLDDFTDSFTKATRAEFGDPDFDPRPAARRCERKV